MAGPSGLQVVGGALPMAAHCVQRYGNMPQAFLSPASVPLFWATWPPLGLDGHGVAPPSDRSIAMMALMPSTELTSTASLPTLMANSPLVTPHGPAGSTTCPCSVRRRRRVPASLTVPMQNRRCREKQTLGGAPGRTTSCRDPGGSCWWARWAPYSRAPHGAGPGPSPRRRRRASQGTRPALGGRGHRAWLRTRAAGRRRRTDRDSSSSRFAGFRARGSASSSAPGE